MIKYTSLLAALTLAACGGGGGDPALPEDTDCVQIPVVAQYDANGQCRVESIRNKAPGLECRFWVGTNWSCGDDAQQLISEGPIEAHRPPEEGDDE